jgi:hypothetical protein
LDFGLVFVPVVLFVLVMVFGWVVKFIKGQWFIMLDGSMISILNTVPNTIVLTLIHLPHQILPPQD